MQEQGSIIPPKVDFSQKTIYATQGNIYALEVSNGTIRRSYPFQGHAHPTVALDVIYVCINGWGKCVIQAIRSDDGAILWSYNVEGHSDGSPTVAEHVVYVSTFHGTIYALDALDGSLLWHNDSGGPCHFPSPAIVDEVVYITPTLNPPAQPFIAALHAKDGATLWKVDITGRNPFPLVVVNDIVYSMHSSSCFAYRRSDGSLLWQQHMGHFCSYPTVVDGKFYIGTSEHKFLAPEFSSEDDVIQPKFLRPPKLIAKTFLCALSAHNGIPLWQQRIGNVDDISALTRPTVSHDIVYVGTNNGYIYALDTKDGALRWDYKTDGSNVAQPVVADDMLYVGSNDGCVYALGAKDGVLLWKTFVSTAVSMRGVVEVERNR